MINRRSLLAAPALILARKADAAFTSFSVAQPSAFPGQPIGGVVPNPVGHAATPPMLGFGGWPGAFRNASLGLGNPTNLNAYSALTGGVIPSGTLSSPTIIAFIDFDCTQLDDGYSLASNLITSNGMYPGHGSPPAAAIHDIVFLGCRFQGKAVENANVDCFTAGSKNIKFLYCSITPPASLHPTPTNPGSWPSASVGTGTVVGTIAAATYSIPYQDSATFGISPGMFGGGPDNFIVIDHCDIWGCADGINLAGGTTGPLTITDNWVHDLRNPSPPMWDPGISYPPNITFVQRGSTNIYQTGSLTPNMGQDPFNETSTGPGYWVVPPFGQIASTHGGDHSNGIGYISGNPDVPPDITIRHNTIASIGNVNALSMQVSTAYNNWTVVNNYLSGFSEPARVLGVSGSTGTNTNITFTDNIIASDIWWASGRPISNDVSAIFTLSNGNNNLWRRNRMLFYPGSSATYAAGFIASSRGYATIVAANPSPYVLPSAAPHQIGATDWTL
jgi:hypothetical protein